MADNDNKDFINIIIASDQLEQIDRVENALRSKLVVNTHRASSIDDVKNILSNDNISVILFDADSSLQLSAVRSAVRELKMNTLILSMLSKTSPRLPNEFIRNGADAVCVSEDPVDILALTKLLNDKYQAETKSTAMLSSSDNYISLFNDLYQGLADPICYVSEGVFVSCNAAFLRVFEVVDVKELDEMTIMNFVERKKQEEFKVHLRKSKTRNLSSSPTVFPMKTKLGKDLEMIVMSKPCVFENEAAVQLYLRSSKDSGSGGLSASLYDETTGLANRNQMSYFLAHTIEDLEKRKTSGCLVYIYIRNYRDVWGADGLAEAEKFIKAVSNHIKLTAPNRTELCRYTDDGILAFVPTLEPEELRPLLEKLISELDMMTPYGMLRMVEPICYASYVRIDGSSSYVDEIAKLFRTARAFALAETSDRVGESSAAMVAGRDMDKVSEVKEVLAKQEISLRYQPVASFNPDGIHRYQILLAIRDYDADKLEEIFAVAIKYNLMREFDRWRITKIFENMLAIRAESRHLLKFFIPVSADALADDDFVKWLGETMKHTGLNPDNFVFELTVDTIQLSYSSAMRLSKFIHKVKAGLLVKGVGSLSKDNERVINDTQPNYIKVDIGEIDTMDETEGAEVMSSIKEKADSINAIVIAEKITSPSQLSRIWPYDIIYVQGEAMTPILEKMNFNFKEFSI